tara:strand:- start:118 stop:708 length:591 start_codon:yes stop_codon:yes gene_type:complete
MKKLSLAVLATSFIAAPVLAEPYGNSYDDDQPDAFIGGSVTYSKMENLAVYGEDIEELGDADELKDDRSSWKAFAGVWITDYIGVEGQYMAIGKFEENGVSFDPDGVTASVLLGIPVAEHTRIYANGGQMWWNADYKGPLGYTDETDGTSLIYGAGVSVAILDNMNVRAEYERTKFDEGEVDADIDFASVGLGFMF